VFYLEISMAFTATAVASAARFVQQSSFDFESIMAETQMQDSQAKALVELQTAHEAAKAVAASFTRLVNDPKGHWTNHYLCSCAENWKVKSNDIANDFCPHCHSEVEPFVSNDGSLNKRQLDNLLMTHQLQMAFIGNDKGSSVFDKLIQTIGLVNYSVENCGEIAYS
jgi:hypothetical protein